MGRQGEADAPSEAFRRKGFKEKLSDWRLHTSLEHISELIFLPFVLYATTLYLNVQPSLADCRHFLRNAFTSPFLFFQRNISEISFLSKILHESFKHACHQINDVPRCKI